MDAVGLRQTLEHAVETDGALVDVVDAAQLRVDRDQVIVGGDLQAVAAVIEQRDVGGRRAASEVVDRPLHPRLVEIDAERDGEAERLQRVGDVARVVGRIGEFGNRAVAALADDQRHPALRPGGRRRDEDQRNREQAERQRRDAAASRRALVVPFEASIAAILETRMPFRRRQVKPPGAGVRARRPFPARGWRRSTFRRRSRRRGSGADCRGLRPSTSSMSLWMMAIASCSARSASALRARRRAPVAPPGDDVRLVLQLRRQARRDLGERLGVLVEGVGDAGLRRAAAIADVGLGGSRQRPSRRRPPR